MHTQTATQAAAGQHTGRGQKNTGAGQGLGVAKADPCELLPQWSGQLLE
jgi:hypothetical protein